MRWCTSITLNPQACFLLELKVSGSNFEKQDGMKLVKKKNVKPGGKAIQSTDGQVLR